MWNISTISSITENILLRLGDWYLLTGGYQLLHNHWEITTKLWNKIQPSVGQTGRGTIQDTTSHCPVSWASLITTKHFSASRHGCCVSLPMTGELRTPPGLIATVFTLQNYILVHSLYVSLQGGRIGGFIITLITGKIPLSSVFGFNMHRKAILTRP